jgi:hypothetical protein
MRTNPRNQSCEVRELSLLCAENAFDYDIHNKIAVRGWYSLEYGGFVYGTGCVDFQPAVDAI